MSWRNGSGGGKKVTIGPEILEQIGKGNYWSIQLCKQAQELEAQSFPNYNIAPNKQDHLKDNRKNHGTDSTLASKVQSVHFASNHLFRCKIPRRFVSDETFTFKFRLLRNGCLA